MPTEATDGGCTTVKTETLSGGSGAAGAHESDGKASFAGGAGKSFCEPATTAPSAKQNGPRLEYLDVAKGFAALSVVLLHLFSAPTLFASLAPWHIWQAMPIFLLVAGITGAMSCRKYSGITGNNGWQKNKEDLTDYYRKLPAKALALYIPYAVVVVIYYMWTRETLGIELFFNTMLMGYLGPGGYFVPLIVQHLIFFPLFMSIRGNMQSDRKFLLFALLFSVLAELPFALCDTENTRFLYRIFYFRYVFACCLGAVLADASPFKKRTFHLLAGLSVLYMALVSLLTNVSANPPQYWNIFIIRSDDWFFQHYPAYFYTAWLVFAIRDHIHRIPCLSWFMALGRSSYDIFIFQMVFFITVVLSLTSGKSWVNEPLFFKLAIFICCVAGGLLLTKAQAKWKSVMKPAKQK